MTEFFAHPFLSALAGGIFIGISAALMYALNGRITGLSVMGAAIAVFGPTAYFFRARSTPLFARTWSIPPRGRITPRLIAGAMLFGIGWGLAGYCPGPAFVSLVALRGSTWLFVIAMLGGMKLSRLVGPRSARDL